MATLIKRLIRGTYKARFEPKYLQNYLNEYVFRFNRHKSKSHWQAVYAYRSEGAKGARITGPEIPWDLDALSEYFATTGASQKTAKVKTCADHSVKITDTML
jgi:hypothetical protein